jgi:hypothetical protein
MTKKQCPLGEDCDLTIAWMKGAEDARKESRTRIAALEAALEEMRELFFECMGAQKSHPLAWEYYTGEKSGDKS